uniref:Uncharacterized protein n=1 Tax=Helianthus annuus TaxID=4232 RepID=A0A251VDW4_HELAN
MLTIKGLGSSLLKNRFYGVPKDIGSVEKDFTGFNLSIKNNLLRVVGNRYKIKFG